LKGYGSIICIPKFGVVRLGEMEVHKHSRTLRMFRVQMCSSGHGGPTAEPAQAAAEPSPRLSMDRSVAGLLCLSSCKRINQAATGNNAMRKAPFCFSKVTKPASAKAEQGFKDSTQYLELNWKFRVLAAEANIRMRHYPKALETP